MSLFGDRLPIDLQRTPEDADLAKVLQGMRESFWKEYDDAFERIRLSRVYDNVGEQVGQAVGSLIDVEADGLAETHDTNVYGFAFHRREPLVRPDFYLDEDE